MSYIVKEYKEWLSKRLSANTTKQYTYWFNRYLKEHPELTEETIKLFYEEHPHSTVKGMIKNLMQFLELPPIPLDPRLTRKKGKQLVKYYENSLARSIIEEFPEEYRLILILMYETGLRVTEAVNMRWTDIKFSQNHVIVTGKGNKERIVYPSPETLTALRNKPRGPDDIYVFSSPYKENSPVTTDLIRKYLKRIHPEATPHKFRHTFATNLLRNRIPLRTIQRALGHEDPKTTSVYTHVIDSDLYEATQKAWYLQN